MAVPDPLSLSPNAGWIGGKWAGGICRWYLANGLWASGLYFQSRVPFTQVGQCDGIGWMSRSTRNQQTDRSLRQDPL